MAFDGRLLGGIGVMAAVVEGGSLARAAEALGLTPSGVSRAVARLEARIGVRLFDRTARATVLTDEGRRFYAEVAPHLAGIEEAATRAGGSRAAVRGRLRVNVDPLFARLALAPRLPEFLATYPELSLEIVARDRLGDLVAEGFDAAVRFGEPEPSALVARRLLETRILTCASPAYLARAGRPVAPADLGGGRHECIHFRDPATGRPFAWEFRGADGGVAGVEVSGRLTVNDVATMLGACLAGHGVAQLMALGVERHLADGTLVELFTDWAEERFPLYAYHPSRHLPPAKVRALLDLVVAASRGQDGWGSA